MKNSITLTTTVGTAKRLHKINLDLVRSINEIVNSTNNYSTNIHFSENDNLSVHETLNDINNLISKIQH